MKPTYHNEIVQGTPEWLDLRLGRVGGSECSPFFSYANKPEKIPDGLVSLAIAKAAEILTQERPESFVTDAMQWGTEWEPAARDAFEEAYFKDVKETGYVSAGKYFGVSPDGIVDGKELLEIKCPQGKEWLRFRYTKEIPKAHLAQMQWGMYLLGISLATYFVWHPSLGHTAKTVMLPDDTKALLDIRTKQYEEIIQEVIESAKN